METKLHQRFLLVNSYGFCVKNRNRFYSYRFHVYVAFCRIRENVYVKIFTCTWFSALPTLTTYVTWRWKSRVRRGTPAGGRPWFIEPLTVPCVCVCVCCSVRRGVRDAGDHWPVCSRHARSQQLVKTCRHFPPTRCHGDRRRLPGNEVSLVSLTGVGGISFGGKF